MSDGGPASQHARFIFGTNHPFLRPDSRPSHLSDIPNQSGYFRREGCVVKWCGGLMMMVATGARGASIHTTNVGNVPTSSHTDLASGTCRSSNI